MITDRDIKRLKQSVILNVRRERGGLQVRIGSTTKYAGPHQFGAGRPFVLGKRIKHLPGKGSRS